MMSSGRRNSLNGFQSSSNCLRLLGSTIILLQKFPPLLHPSGRWQHFFFFFLKTTKFGTFVPSPFFFSEFASAVCWKTTRDNDAPTSKLPRWCGVLETTQFLLSSKHGVYFAIQKVTFWFHPTRLQCPRIPQTSLYIGKPETCFSMHLLHQWNLAK